METMDAIKAKAPITAKGGKERALLGESEKISRRDFLRRPFAKSVPKEEAVAITDPQYQDTLKTIDHLVDLNWTVANAINTGDDREIKYAKDRERNRMSAFVWAKFAEDHPDKIKEFAEKDVSINASLERYALEQDKLDKLKKSALEYRKANPKPEVVNAAITPDAVSKQESLPFSQRPKSERIRALEETIQDVVTNNKPRDPETDKPIVYSPTTIEDVIKSLNIRLALLNEEADTPVGDDLLSKSPDVVSKSPRIRTRITSSPKTPNAPNKETKPARAKRARRAPGVSSPSPTEATSDGKNVKISTKASVAEASKVIPAEPIVAAEPETTGPVVKVVQSEAPENTPQTELVSEASSANAEEPILKNAIWNNKFKVTVLPFTGNDVKDPENYVTIKGEKGEIMHVPVSEITYPKEGNIATRFFNRIIPRRQKQS